MIAMEKDIEVGLTIRHKEFNGYSLTTFQEEEGTRYAISTLITKNIRETLVYIAYGNWVENFHEVYAESYETESVAIVRHSEIANNLVEYLD